MEKKAITLLILLSTFAVTSLKSQSMYFTGLGRAKVTSSTFKDSSSTEDGKSTGGYTLFDLGVHGEPGEELRASVVLRLRNEFGGFFGDGSQFLFRQMRLEGTIENKVRYELGDIDIKLTPYTLHNFGTIYNDYESQLFEDRRDIINYENFYHGNKWRMQGVNLATSFQYTNPVVNEVMVRAFGTRIKGTNNVDLPDRLFVGGEVDIMNNKLGSIGLNYTRMFDVVGTVPDTAVQYQNEIFTVDFDIHDTVSNNFRVGIAGETGMSDYSFYQESRDSTVSLDDYFYDVGVSATYLPMNIKLEASYRNVGAFFSSPGAQTRRLLNARNGSPQLYPSYNTESMARTPSLFDRYSQEQGLYNRSIVPTLLPYRPEYNNVTPYGPATPNREGFTVNASIDDSSNLVNANVQAQLLSEIEPEGTSEETRDYTSISGGIEFNIHNLIGWQKAMKFQGGFRNENTQRDGEAPVDFQSLLIDLGFNVEVFDRVKVLGAYKMVNASGTELLPVRNDFNPYDIEEFGSSVYETDLNEGISVVGIRYGFNSRSFFTAQAHFVNYSRNDVEGLDYTLNQAFLNYTLQF